MNLNQVTVAVADVEKSIRFYETLGLQLIVKSLLNYARFECPEGESTFSLQQTDALPKESNVWIYFEVNDLDEYVEKLIVNGMLFKELPNDKPWLWRESRLNDLDNNQIILYSAGKNRKDPPWKIK